MPVVVHTISLLTAEQWSTLVTNLLGNVHLRSSRGVWLLDNGVNVITRPRLRPHTHTQDITLILVITSTRRDLYQMLQVLSLFQVCVCVCVCACARARVGERSPLSINTALVCNRSKEALV